MIVQNYSNPNYLIWQAQAIFSSLLPAVLFYNYVPSFTELMFY